MSRDLEQEKLEPMTRKNHERIGHTFITDFFGIEHNLYGRIHDGDKLWATSESRHCADAKQTNKRQIAFIKSATLGSAPVAARKS